MSFKHKQLSKVSAVPQRKKVHAYIATPAYDGRVETNYSQALAEAMFTAPLFGIQVTAGVKGNGAFIDLARNVFAWHFLTEFKECTHLFFIDADLKFPPNAFIGLLQADLPVSCGIYRRRQEPEEYPFKGTENPDGGGLWFVDEWLQCDRVPTGFLCIRRDVIEEMAKDAPKVRIHPYGEIPWLFHESYQDEGGLKAIAEKHNLSPEFLTEYGKWIPTDGARFVGEDYSWADDYTAKYKKPIQAWTNFDFIHGGLKGNLFEWLTREVEKKDKEQTSSAA